MGWASGSSLMDDIVEQINKRCFMSVDQKEQLYKVLIDCFENRDCDTLQEINDKTFKKVYQQIHGSDDEDDYD